MHSFPETYDGGARLAEYFVTLSAGLKATDARDGCWRLVARHDIGDPADRAFRSLVDGFVTENECVGTLSFEGTVEVGLLSSNGTYEVSLVSVFRGDKRIPPTDGDSGSTASASRLSRTTTEEAACGVSVCCDRVGSSGIRNEGDGDEQRFDSGMPLVEVERRDVGQVN
ncbi:hypothetical protein ACRE_029490 [Hapsidospora chrysogenum ATCC 11550]|uniref:Uncharacterized protein n=1 Tax=Hapsidospora chrysogenum (strain ATCC 11550 / CBS 779.69 / DSM 880 / IAM 14645 / JCM 23072 / IMI 49137) TaxID=857340 RepID=A0A086TA87_HAPC1|nr:hypothetical protein ACRE_029490 [Hapsidospora chrysogenum ATCC 11550]